MILIEILLLIAVVLGISVVVRPLTQAIGERIKRKSPPNLAELVRTVNLLHDRMDEFERRLAGHEERVEFLDKRGERPPHLTS